MAVPAYIFAVPPFLPIDVLDQLRVEEQRRRRRLLYGGWRYDATARTLERIGSDRTDAWGCPVLTSNVFFSCADALAVLYDEPGSIGNTLDPSAVDDMTALLEKGGWWPMMQRYQRDTLGFREMLMMVEVERVAQTGDPVADCLPRFRPVFPDLCELLPDPVDPTRPIEVTEYRQRPGGLGLLWTKERWSLLGPVHQVSDGSRDVSSMYGLPDGGAGGTAYPTRYVRSDGKPVLPYVLHHAAVTGCLLDPYCWSELVEGTLEIAVDKTFLSHCKRNAAFGKIVAIGCSPVEQRDVNGRNVSVSDPSVVHKFAPDAEFDGQPSVTMLSQAVDIAALADTISQDTREAAVFAGVDPADFQRMEGDPRSGYALALSQDGKKKAARRYAPVAQRGDAEVIALVAIQVNRLMGAEIFPEEGWTLEYAPLAGATSEGAAAGAGAGAAGAAGPAVAVADTALTGVQVQSLLQIVEDVAAGKVPRDSAVAILQRAFQVSLEEADVMVGSAGKGFKLEAAPLPAPPGAPPPNPNPPGPPSSDAPPTA